MITFWITGDASAITNTMVASVLGTVQGAALRSARAYARPSGLDGACAQMIGGQLRDGRRMPFPSGTNGALIDPSDGLEKRSYMFDRFRTRAFHPLVEVHFSRFRSLTVVASGATLCVFVGAARTALRESVTDAEQLIIVAFRAAINSYLERAGNDRRCARPINSLGLADDCSQSTTLAGHTPKRSPHCWRS